MLYSVVYNIPKNIHHRVTDMQTMYIDIFFACTLPYLISKIQPLVHIMALLLLERSANAIRRKTYDTSGFTASEEFVSLPYYPTTNKGLFLSVYDLGMLI